VLEAVLARLEVHFARFPISTGAGFPSHISRLGFAICGEKPPEIKNAVIEALETAISKISFEANPSRACALVHLFNVYLRMAPAFPHLLQIFQLFLPVLQIQIPFPNELFYVIFCFLKNFNPVKVDDKRLAELGLISNGQDFLNVFSNLLLNERVPQEMRDHFAVLFESFFRENGARFQPPLTVSVDFILSCLATGNKKFFRAMGVVAGYLANPEAEFAMICGRLEQILRESGNQETFSVVLSFFAAAAFSEPEYPLANQFLRSIAGICLENAELAPQFFDAIEPGALGLAGFGFFYDEGVWVGPELANRWGPCVGSLSRIVILVLRRLALMKV
jgi:hypothetical protein